MLDDVGGDKKKKTAGKGVEAEFVAGAFITLFMLMSQLRPEPLRPLWTLSDDELDSLVPPVTRWLNRQPAAIVRQINDIADPAMAAAAFGSIVISRLAAEQQYYRELRAARAHGAGAGPAESVGAPGGGAEYWPTRFVNDNGSVHLRNG